MEVPYVTCDEEVNLQKPVRVYRQRIPFKKSRTVYVLKCSHGHEIHVFVPGNHMPPGATICNQYKEG